jgi:dUTP pyrophosphatase
MCKFEVMNNTIKIINTSNNPNPEYKTKGSSGMDVRAFLAETVEIEPLNRALIKTGVFIEMDETLECQVRPRSGLALKKGITVLNSPGTIDADYRGEIGIILMNLSDDKVVIQSGDRIAQLVFAKVEKVVLENVDVVNKTVRGDGGFGSTGIK